jgi:hypothetical protein
MCYCNMTSSYLCNLVSFLIFFISKSTFVRETFGRWPLLSNGERNWKFLGTLRSLLPSILSIEHVKETFVKADSVAIFCDIVPVGVIITKLSSSSVNSWSSSESSLATSSALSITYIRPCSDVHISASWLVLSCVCAYTIAVGQSRNVELITTYYKKLK